MRNRFILVFVLLSAAFLANAQQFKHDSQVLEYIEDGKDLMAAGDYGKANTVFRKALATKKVLPTNFSYFFAEALFMVKQYKNSENFADKYISLAGKSGEYYGQASNLKSLVSEEFLAIRECNFCDLNGYRLHACQTCKGDKEQTQTCPHCKGNGITMCSKCIGKGVIISTNSLLQKTYHTCDLCDGEGLVSCPVCNGDKTITVACVTCLGTGLQSTDEICDHQPHLEIDY